MGSIERYRFHANRARMYAAGAQPHKSRGHELRAESLLARFGEVSAKRPKPSRFLDVSAKVGNDDEDEDEDEDDAVDDDDSDDDDDDEEDDESYERHAADDEFQTDDVSFRDVAAMARYVRAMLWPNGNELTEPRARRMIDGGGEHRFGDDGAFDATWFVKKFGEALGDLECMEDYSGQGAALQHQSDIVRKVARRQERNNLLVDIQRVTDFVYWKAQTEVMRGDGMAAEDRATASEYMDFLRFFALTFIHGAHRATERAQRKARPTTAAMSEETHSMLRNLRRVMERTEAAGAPMARERVFDRIVWLLSRHADSALSAHDKRSRFESWVRTLTADAEPAAGTLDDDGEGGAHRYARFLKLGPTQAGLVGGTYGEFLDAAELKERAADVAWVRQNEIRWLEAAKIGKARIAHIVRARDRVLRRYIQRALGSVDEAADESLAHLAARREGVDDPNDASRARRAAARDRATARAHAVMTMQPIEPAGLPMSDFATLQLTGKEKDALAAFAESDGSVTLYDAAHVLDGESWRFARSKRRARICASIKEEIDAEHADGDESWPFAGWLDRLHASVDRICRSWRAVLRELRHGARGTRAGARRLLLANGDDTTQLASVAKLHAANLERQYQRQLRDESAALEERAREVSGLGRARRGERDWAADWLTTVQTARDESRRARSERRLRRDDAKQRDPEVDAMREKYGASVARTMRGELLRHDAENRARARASLTGPQPGSRRIPNRLRIPDDPDE